MILDLIIDVFVTLILNPMNAILPAWTTPAEIENLDASIITEGIMAFDSLVPIWALYTIIINLIVVGLALLPVMFIVWLWGAIRP